VKSVPPLLPSVKASMLDAAEAHERLPLPSVVRAWPVLPAVEGKTRVRFPPLEAALSVVEFVPAVRS
jgi:hypothetical protein